MWGAKVTASQLKGRAEDVQRADEHVEEEEEKGDLGQTRENGAQPSLIATACACW